MTQVYFEERIIVTFSESGNDICYFENRCACALAAYFESKVVLLTEGLTCSEESLQEYSWSGCWHASLCVHGQLKNTVLSLPVGDPLSKDV